MSDPSFSSLWFGWIFCGALIALLAMAAWTDSSRFLIPKWITLPMLGLGIVASIVRSVLLAGSGQGVNYLEVESAWLGGVDGFLFSLAGFAVGFGLLLVLWLLKSCGGGDVKLFAALGAWVGPWYVVIIWGVSVGVLIVLAFVKVLSYGLTPSAMEQVKKDAKRPKKNKDSAEPPAAPKFRMSYALPVLLATLGVFYRIFGDELGLVPSSE